MDVLAEPYEEETTTDGTVQAGALEIAFKNIGTITAMVNGVSIAPGEAWNYGFVGKPYKSINYQCNGSTLRIRYTI
jgi:hypothetical protein